MMAEKPILFNGPMVRAILEGRKTQTRRVMNPQPALPLGRYRYDGEGDGTHWLELFKNDCPTERYFVCEKPPYQPGDRLWVRETFRTVQDEETGAERFIYRADPDKEKNPYARWKPSIHMPRSASRITLEVTDVRAERLQDISPNDCIAEGAWRIEDKAFGRGHEAVAEYRALWEKLYGPGSWEANPWVWVICFKVAEVKE
ncbi:MAG: hypothetical protein NC211_03830 [Alistipes senegalensis]|nr:hypothetical protein [Oxalobacter formigenes]MCM1280948.1 hypothetical protein [Alistipes senegalensis]